MPAYQQLPLPDLGTPGRLIPWPGVGLLGPAKDWARKWRRCSACRKARAATGREFCRGCLGMESPAGFNTGGRP